MPLYEYQCLSCGEVTEALQRMSDDPLTDCQSCGGNLKRLVSAPAVQFKGTGWYVTDYAGKKGGDGKGDGAKGSGGSESGAKKAESKSSDSGAGDKKSTSSKSSSDKKSA